MRCKRAWCHQFIAIALALSCLGLLRAASSSTGYVRDEAAYFAASLKIKDWLGTLVQDPKLALVRKDKAFGYNNEHPAGIKLMGALTLSSQTQSQGKIPGQTIRWAAQSVTAIGVYLLAIIGMARYGIAVGAFCALAFVALPRVFFHAQLHCFDLAIAVAALGVAAAFSRLAKRPSLRNAVRLGVCFGLSLSVKHNALLFPIFLGGAFVWDALKGKRNGRDWARMLGWGALAVAIGGLVFVMLWPWLWSSPWDRWLEYINFHRTHSYYNMAFLGQNYNQPPLPIAYPWVLTAFTWPLSWLLLLVAGTFAALKSACRRTGLSDRVDLVMALGPILLISLPSVPIFGGTKHWITAYPFCCLLMGRSLASLFERIKVTKKWDPVLRASSLALILAPAVLDNWRSHPHQLAQYASWMGGPRAAARLGMGRAFWGSMCVPKALAKLEGPGRLFTHDLHPYLLRAYRDDGLATGIRSGSRSKANWALHFYEDHFLIDELWTQRRGFGYAPTWVCELDDVPLMSLYQKDAAKK